MKIIILIGNPASGKSTYAQSYCRANPGTIRINADKMRGIIAGDESNMEHEGFVWRTIERMGEYLLDCGLSLIIDNLNKDRKSRKFWIKLADKYFIKPEAVIINTPLEVCKDRNSARLRKVPDEVFERFKLGYEAPTLEEGFKSITIINE